MFQNPDTFNILFGEKTESTVKYAEILFSIQRHILSNIPPTLLLKIKKKSYYLIMEIIDSTISFLITGNLAEAESGAAA